MDDKEFLIQGFEYLVSENLSKDIQKLCLAASEMSRHTDSVKSMRNSGLAFDISDKIFTYLELAVLNEFSSAFDKLSQSRAFSEYLNSTELARRLKGGLLTSKSDLERMDILIVQDLSISYRGFLDEMEMIVILDGTESFKREIRKSVDLEVIRLSEDLKRSIVEFKDLCSDEKFRLESKVKDENDRDIAFSEKFLAEQSQLAGEISFIQSMIDLL